MNFKLVRAFTVGAIAVGAATMVHAQQMSTHDLGEQLGLAMLPPLGTLYVQNR